MKERSQKPPSLPLKLLRWFCNPDLIEDVEGDLTELFKQRYENSKITARLYLWGEVLLLFRPGIIKNFEPFNQKINYAMLYNYLKIARRNAMLYKGYTFLNLLGLVTGITSSLLILLWINDEVQKDKFHEKGETIYQLFRNMNQGGDVATNQNIPKPAADLIAAEYPEVDKVVLFSWPMEIEIGEGDDKSSEDGHYVTPEFLNVFSFNLLLGDPATALDGISNILLSKRVAENHFGENWKSNALGATVIIDGENEVKVAGVFDDPGDQSTLDFDWLLPAERFTVRNQWMEDWGNGSFSVFLTINDESKVKVVGERVVNEIKDHTKGASNAGDETLILHKFQDYYLYSNFENGVVNGGRIVYVRIMTIVAVLILIIACINFMNLTTARSDRRSKEIGLRKVMGAKKGSISVQFFTESFVFATIAVALSLLIAWLALPYFNLLVDKTLTIDFTSTNLWLLVLALAVGVGLLSGSYPALVLPAFNIIESLKGGKNKMSSSASIRKGLVVFQFAISTLLIIGTSTIYQQLDYVLNKDLGLDKENLLDVRIDGDSLNQFNAYKSELLKLSHVKAVSGTSGNPVSYGRSTSSADWEGKDPDAGYEINIILTDEDFISTMGMEMKSGRAFSKEYADSTNFIINEVAAQLMGFDDPIAKNLSFWGIKGQIIGVVKDFHMSNMHDPIAPLIISCIDPGGSSSMMIRLQGDISQAITEVEAVTKRVYPNDEFQYRFADELLERNYESERTASLLVNIFAGISILISCLGLFGLSAFTAEQRSKEVGVRKVLGSGVWQIIFMLSKEYAKLIIWAFIIAIPFGYYIMQDWLNEFEFRTILQPQVFLLAGLISLIIGALTISIKSYQAAVVNPVKSLRNE